MFSVSGVGIRREGLLYLDMGLHEKGSVTALMDDHFVFVLGAGASVHADAPVMSTFLSTARSIGQKLGAQGRSPFDLVFRAISKLQRAQVKGDLDLQNLETISGAFQMAHRLRVFPGLSDQEIEWLPSAMSSVIATTLDESVQFPADDVTMWPTEGYGALAHMIRDLGEGNCSIITLALIYLTQPFTEGSSSAT